jgi:hypothetical protein
MSLPKLIKFAESARYIGINFNDADVDGLRLDRDHGKLVMNDPRFLVRNKHVSDFLDYALESMSDCSIRHISDNYDLVLGVPKKSFREDLAKLEERFPDYTCVLTIDRNEDPMGNLKFY